MLYEEYEKKLQKLVRIRDFFYFTRFLWIGILVIALGATGALVGTKGMVTKTDIAGFAPGETATFVYGTDENAIQDAFSADAFLGEEVVYEWQKKGTDTWSEQTPTEPGEYYVRARSKNNFGGYYYSEPREVQITPRPLEITIDTISTYGQKPGITASGLARGDQIVGWDVVYDDITKANPKVKLSSITVHNREAADATACYTGYLKDFEEHTMKNVALTITTPSDEKKYDGKPLTAKDFLYDANELVDGDYLDEDRLLDSMTSAVTDYSGSAVQNLFSTSEVSILNSQDKDVTKHYSIRPNLGNLMIQKRSITLTSPSLSKTYDGTAIANYDDSDPFLHENQGVEVGGDGLALYSGDYLKVTFQNVGKYHAGTYQNSFNYKICRMVQGEEVDVENNYNVSTAFGTLTINKKPLTYTVDSQQFDYDGTAHTSILPTHSGLAAGDAITFTPKATITKPSEGSVQATFDVSISNGGESRTSDYQITAGNIGSLSVKKRAITVQFHDLTNAYNGETYRLDDSPSKYDLGGDPLILDHTLDVSGGKSLKDVGSISDAPTVKVRDSSGNDVSSEYDISVLPGTITVTKAPLTVTVDPVEATFGDGGGSGANYSSYSVTSDLATGDTFNPVFGSGQIHHTAGTKLSFGYKITNASGADVTNNYKALVEGENLTLGSVVVHKRAVSLTPVFSGSNQKQYDGTPLVPSSISADNLAAGDHLENTYEFLDCPSQYTDTPQVVSIKADSVKIVNSTGSDVTDDYDITLNTTTAQILKRSLTCNIQSATQEIDSSLTVKKTFSNLLPGETIDEANLNWTISAGMVTLDESSLIIRNGNNDVTTSNYNLSCNSVGLVEATYSVRFGATATQLAKVYDGNDLGWDWLKPGSEGTSSTVGVNLTSGSLRPGDHYVVSGVLNSPLNSYTAGNYTGQYIVHIYDGADNLVDAYYNFNGTQNGSVALSISRRPITITTDGYTGTYDGEVHPVELFESQEGYSITSGELAANDTLSGVSGAKYYISPTATKVAGTFSIKHQNPDSSLTDVTSSYTITRNDGNVTISKKNITLAFGNTSVDYDGTSISSSNDLKDLLTEAPDLVAGDELSLSISTPLSEPGSTVMSQKVSATITRGGENRNNCYNITITGTYTINKRAVTYYVGDVSRTYDDPMVDISGASIYVTSGSFLPGDHLEATYLKTGEPTAPGTQTDAIGVRVLDSLGQDRARYYTLTLDVQGYGDYTVSKRTVSFDVDTALDTLNQGTYSVPTPSATNIVGLVGADYISIEQKQSNLRPDKAGIYDWDQWITIKILSGTGQDRTAFYDMEINGGTLKLISHAISVKVNDTTLDVGQDSFTPNYTAVDSSGLMAGHEIKVEFQNVNNLKNEILEDQPFQYTIKVVDSSTQADVSSQYDIEDQTVGTPKLTTLFPDVSYRLEAREYTYEGAIDPSTKIITRNVTTVSGELPKTYDIKFTCYYDGSYTFSVTHNNQDVTAKVAPHIIVDNSILPVEKARQAYISVPNKQLTTTSTTVQTPYSSADISITNFPLASGDYIASASFLYNGSAYINIYDNGSGEMQIFTFEVTIADLSIVNAAGYPTNYDFNYSGATATLTIIYMPV